MIAVAEEKKHTSAVNPDGSLHHVSVSACEKLEGCERQFHFRYVQHLEEPKAASQELGTAGHLQLENTVKSGQDVLGPIARPALEHIPARAEWPSLWVERKIEDLIRLEAIPGVPLVGGFDLVRPTLPLPLLRDYKFTSDPKRYGLKQDEAQTNLQLGTYSYVLMQVLGAPSVDAGLIYLATRGKPKAHPVLVTIDRAQGEMSWSTIKQRAARMADVARVKDVKQLKPTLKTCFKYGGKPCAFWGQCPLTMGERLTASRLRDERNNAQRNRSTTKEALPVSSLLESLKSQQNAPAVAVVPAVPQPTPELEVGAQYRLTNGAIVTFRQVKEGGILAFEDSIGGVYHLAGMKAIEGRVGARPAAPAAPPPAPVVAFDPRSVLPADAPKSDPALAALPLPVAGDIAPVSPTEDKPKRTRRTKAEMEAARAAPTAAVQVIVAPAPVVSAPVITTIPIPIPIAQQAAIGQMLRAETTPTIINVSPARTPEFLAASEELAETLEDAPETLLPVATAVAGLVLYVNCRPTRVQAADLAPYVAERAAFLAKQAGAIDVRFADGTPLAFGKWKGALYAAVLESPPSGACFIERSELAEPVIEALKSIASEVVQ